MAENGTIVRKDRGKRFGGRGLEASRAKLRRDRDRGLPVHLPFDLSSIQDERFATVFQVLSEMPIGLLGQRNDRTIIGSNDSLRTSLGYGGPEDLHGVPMVEIIAPELRTQFLSHVEALEQGNRRAYATVLQRRDGTTFPAMGIPQSFSRRDWEEIVGFHFLVDLATVHTAEGANDATDSPSGTLDRVALELRALSLMLSVESGPRVPLEHPELQDLSEREREVLVQLVDGQRVATIAKRLHISPSTVRNHLKSIFRKLDVSSQAALLEYVEALSS